MDQIINFIKPELLAVAIVLYFVGMWMKEFPSVKNKYIPLILGGIGIVLSAVWVFATTEILDAQDLALAVFTSVVQGVLVAGLSTYANQIYKQMKKEE